jgi:hypothetical protein
VIYPGTPDFPRYRNLHAETVGSLAGGADRGVVARSNRLGAAVMTGARWYARPEGEGITLRKAPRLASWNKVTDPDQVSLREYLADTAELLGPSLVSGPWTLQLDVGLPTGRDLTDMADLDNYAFPLATHLRNQDMVSVWCTKRHADSSRVIVARAQHAAAPATTFTVRTTASSETKAYKEQVHAAVAHASELLDPAVHLQIAFMVGPQRNWLNLWKPTIDALDPLLGRTQPDRNWHPRDGRIVDLGLHVVVDPSLGYDVLMEIAAEPADS